MAWDLEQLGPTGFQDLAGALAVAAFGPGVQAMGTGRDGGRDLYHPGPLHWAPQENQPGEVWDGYSVFQVKHKERLDTAPGDNARWLQGQIRAELDIAQEQNMLVVSGQKAGEDASQYLHRGIAGRTFKRRFELADYVKVQSASLSNGLLMIELVREVHPAFVDPEAGVWWKMEADLSAPLHGSARGKLDPFFGLVVTVKINQRI